MTYNQKMDRLSFTALYVYFCISIDLPDGRQCNLPSGRQAGMTQIGRIYLCKSFKSVLSVFYPSLR